jgi:hypothetical protein
MRASRPVTVRAGVFFDMSFLTLSTVSISFVQINFDVVNVHLYKKLQQCAPAHCSHNQAGRSMFLDTASRLMGEMLAVM